MSIPVRVSDHDPRAHAPTMAPRRPRRQSSSHSCSRVRVWRSRRTTHSVSRPETQTPRSPQTTVACAGPRAGGAGPSTPRQRGARGGIVTIVRSSNDVFGLTFPAQGSRLRNAAHGSTLLHWKLRFCGCSILSCVDNFLRLRLTKYLCKVELGGSIGFGAARRRLRAQRLPR